MGNSFPAPNKFLQEEPAGRDFLGQQSFVQYMADKCLPSFTNATRMVRYYSFWAWAFKMLELNIGRGNKGEDPWWYLMKLETALIISNKHRNPNITGMPGISKIPYTADEIKNFDFDTEVTIYSRERKVTSYSAVQYSPSIGSLNIVRRDGHEYSILKYGQRLSEIFDKSIRNYKGYNLLVSPKSEKIKWGLLKEMEDAFSLEIMPQEEQHVLIEIIEQSVGPVKVSSEKSQRVHTTLFILDAVQKLEIKNPDDLLINLWRGDYDPPKALIDNTEGWMLIEARRYYQIAIEAILSSFCKYISSFKSDKGDFHEFSADVIKNFSRFQYHESKEKQFAKIIKNDDTLEQFINNVSEMCNRYKVDEADLAMQIENLSKKKKAFDYNLVHSAIILLLLLYCRFSDLKKLKSQKAVHYWHYRPPYSVKHSFHLIDKMISKWRDQPVSMALNKIIQNFSLKLHLGVSQEKWMQTGNFTFRYTKAEPTGFELLKSMEPNRTSNKIFTYIQLITNLGLITKQTGVYQSTSVGKAFFKKHMEEYKTKLHMFQ